MPFPLTTRITLNGNAIKIACTGEPLQLTIGDGKCRLHLYPEVPLVATQTQTHFEYLIVEPDHYFCEISGAIRLGDKEHLLIGRGEPEQEHLFHYPHTVARRHLLIYHMGDHLMLKDLAAEGGTAVEPVKPQQLHHLWYANRINNLLKLREIIGGALQLPSHSQALKTIRAVNALMATETHRPLNSNGEPGGVIYIPHHYTPIIVGDLHAKVENLVRILSENQFLNALENDTAVLVILGDATHEEDDHRLGEMSTSVLMMELIFRLKLRFPKQVFYLRGNHDSFAPNVRKAGVAQGVEFEHYLRREYGAEYLEQMIQFHNRLAYIAHSKDFLACHAAPPSSSPTVEQLVNIHNCPGLARELIWNRIRQTNRPGGYTPGDVKRFRKSFNMPDEAVFIVAHNPLARKQPCQLNVGGVTHHHIIFSGLPEITSVVTRIRGRMVPLDFPMQPTGLVDLMNSLDTQ